MVVTVIKKRNKPFFRHQCDRKASVPSSWRRPHGIDSHMRRRFRGRRPLVNIGYGNNKKTRGMDRDGLKRFLVHNVADVDLLLMHNGTYKAEIAHDVSSKKRIDIVARAKALSIKVSNGKAKLQSVDA